MGISFEQEIISFTLHKHLIRQVSLLFPFCRGETQHKEVKYLPGVAHLVSGRVKKTEAQV